MTTRPAARPDGAPAVLFDMFGVLARLQTPADQDRLRRLANAPEADFRHHYWALRPAYDRGERTAAAYWGEVATALGTSFDARTTAALVAADLASWRAVDEEMVGYVRALAAAGVPTGLLSNIPEDLAADHEQRHAWLGTFTVTAFSCRIGAAKPDPAAYTWCLEAFGLPPERVLFVDDRAENVTAARQLGLHAHLFTSLRTLEPVVTAHLAGRS